MPEVKWSFRAIQEMRSVQRITDFLHKFPEAKETIVFQVTQQLENIQLLLTIHVVSSY